MKETREKEVKKLKSGDIEMIYDDPITRKRPEGKARLMKKLIPSPVGMEYWQVQFLSDRVITERFISAKE